MIEGQFDVIFRGQTIKNFDIAEVKSNLVNLFKSSPEAVEKLFCGEEVVVKKSLDYTTAMKYQSALKKAGALALIKEIEVNSPATTTTTDQAVSNSFNQTQQTRQSIQPNQPSESINTPTVETNQAPQPAPDDSASSLTVAEVGAQILPDKVYEKREVDTSDLSLAAAGERIMPKKPPEEHKQPSIDHLSLEN